jgi:hypothetical protein
MLYTVSTLYEAQVRGASASLRCRRSNLQVYISIVFLIAQAGRGGSGCCVLIETYICGMLIGMRQFSTAAATLTMY